MAQREKEDISIYQGETKNFTFNVSGTAGAYASAQSVTLSVKKSIDDSAVLFSETATDSQNGNSWTNGVIVIKITAANSALLVPNCVYDLKVVKSGGEVQVPCFGDILVKQKVFA